MLYYIGMLLWFIVGNILSGTIIDSKENPAVSVIIAIRNGEEALPHLLTDLSLQDYSGAIEFILIDDESIDSTKKIIQEKPETRFLIIAGGVDEKYRNIWKGRVKTILGLSFDNLEKIAEEMRSSSSETLLLKRMGVPEDVAGLVLFLASDLSQWITASNFIAKWATVE